MSNLLVRNRYQSAEKPAARAAGKGHFGKPQLNLPPVIGHDQIAVRARQLWQEKGCPQGCDEQNWLDAERELREELHLL